MNAPQPHTLRSERGESIMNNKQKQKSFENRQNQQSQPENQNLRQEIPDRGGKSQYQNPEMDGKACRHHNNGQN